MNEATGPRAPGVQNDAPLAPSLPSMKPKTLVPRALVALLVLSVAPAPVPAAQSYPPPYVLNDVRLVDQPDAPRVSLVLREGRIAGVVEEAQARVPGARRIDGQGMLAVPAFVDAFTQQGIVAADPLADRDRPTPTASDVQVEMRSANRKGIRAAFRAVESLDPAADALEPWRKAGFGVVHVAPIGELLAGRSAVVTARDGPPRERVLRPSAFQSASFQASGRGYPGTLMGYHAHLRQFFLDAEHHALLQQRRREGKPAPRPPFDPELEAAQGLLRGAEPLLCFAEGAPDVSRWLRLAEEFGLKLSIAGGAQAFERAATLAQARVPVFLTLEWGKEVPDPDATKGKGRAEKPAPKEDQAAEEELPVPGRIQRAPAAQPEIEWTYEEPLEVRRERRRLWEERRAGALRLHEAGVRFAFGSGAGKPGDLLARVRTLVEQGLPRTVALEALTRGAAELLGIADRVGRIEVGYEAHLALWTASPFDEGARVAWIVIDGFPQRFEVEPPKAEDAPKDGLDVSGEWTLVFESERPLEPTHLALEMDSGGKVSGAIRFFSPFAEEEVHGTVSGQVSGTRLRLVAQLLISGFEVDTALVGELDGDGLTGKVTWRFSQGEQTANFSAERTPREDGR